jgi:hypothetical protein
MRRSIIDCPIARTLCRARNLKNAAAALACQRRKVKGMKLMHAPTCFVPTKLCLSRAVLSFYVEFPGAPLDHHTHIKFNQHTMLHTHANNKKLHFIKHLEVHSWVDYAFFDTIATKLTKFYYKYDFNYLQIMQNKF